MQWEEQAGVSIVIAVASSKVCAARRRVHLDGRIQNLF